MPAPSPVHHILPRAMRHLRSSSSGFFSDIHSGARYQRQIEADMRRCYMLGFLPLCASRHAFYRLRGSAGFSEMMLQERLFALHHIFIRMQMFLRVICSPLPDVSSAMPPRHFLIPPLAPRSFSFMSFHFACRPFFLHALLLSAAFVMLRRRHEHAAIPARVSTYGRRSAYAECTARPASPVMSLMHADYLHAFQARHLLTPAALLPSVS